ncbi:MAG: SRPBCC family protein [Anaerolineae bacterium]
MPSHLANYSRSSLPKLGVGTTYRFVAQGLGRRVEQDCEITEYEPNRKWCFKITSGVFPGEGCTTFETVEGGTKVTMAGKADVGGFFKLAEPIVARFAHRQWEASLGNLKDILEAGA